jgi:hypothetical protein
MKQAASRGKDGLTHRTTLRYIPEGRTVRMERKGQNIPCDFAHLVKFDVLLLQKQNQVTLRTLLP